MLTRAGVQLLGNDGLLPWLAILGTWLAFGSFAVPMKWRSVVDAEVHPLIYQSYKTFWTFITSHLILFYQPYEFTWWGILSGFLWVPAGVAAVVVVRHLGIAYGQPLWQDEAVYSWRATVAALTCLVLGMLGMTISFATFGDRESCHPKKSERRAVQPVLVQQLELGAAQEPIGASTADDTAATAGSAQNVVPASNGNAPTQTSVGNARGGRRYEPVPVESHLSKTEPKDLEPASSLPSGRSAFIGITAALFNGMWGGSCYVPSKYSPLQGTHFVISFATGALIANTLLMVSYILLAKLTWGRALPSPHFRVMALPGFLSGTLWSVGNFLSMYCIRTIGFAIGGTLIQCNVIVAGLWGIFFYREITGKPVLCWSICCATCLIGSFFLALQKKTVS